MLMGGGGSFSAGSPGKGMYSRLYLRVLNAYPQIHAFSAFSSIYNNNGLFGIQAATFHAVDKMVVSEDIGRQFLTYGERKPVEHFLKAIDAISAIDIPSVAQKLVSSPLTMASYGDVLSHSTYDAVSSRFHSK